MNMIDKKMQSLSRLIQAAKTVSDGAVMAEGNCCEVALEDIQELEAAIKELEG